MAVIGQGLWLLGEFYQRKPVHALITTTMLVLAILALPPIARAVFQEGPHAPSFDHCAADTEPGFHFGFAELKSRLGDTMGLPTDCEYPIDAEGDTVQPTTTGVATYRRAVNSSVFSIGHQHWAIRPESDDVAYWRGGDEPAPYWVQQAGMLSD